MGGRVLLLAVSPRHIQTAAAQPAAGLHRSLVVRFFGNAYKNHKNNNNCLKKKKTVKNTSVICTDTNFLSYV